MGTNPQLEKLLARRILARRRLLQFTQMTHPSYSAGWVHDDICRRLERFSAQVAARKSPRLMLLMPPRHGKLIADDVLVYTSTGWKTHGTLVVGDKVLGLRGWTTVIGVSVPGFATHEVITTEGTRIPVHKNHEWTVSEYHATGKSAKRRLYDDRVIETNVLISRKKKFGHLKAGNTITMRRYYLPTPDLSSFVPRETLKELLQYRKYRSNGGKTAIEDVVELETPLPGRCIQVDAADGTYLVTRELVPTHNSELASIRFPAWHLGHHPEHEIINVGYNLELPMKFSRKVREVFRDSQYTAIFPDAVLDPDSQSVEAWNTTRGGGFTAAGVGGGITGKGAHILIVDDPIKNQEEADNVATREKLWDWYQSTAYTRLAPGGGVLVIETWWNDDDLAGRLQSLMAAEADADQFEIIRYPALSEYYEYRDNNTNEIIRTPERLMEPLDLHMELLREKDTCLHEARYPTEALKRIRSNLQPRIWSALYQQNPVPDEGMYFQAQYFSYQPAIPSLHGLRLYTAWDFAIGEKQQNDWTVGVTILQDENDTIHVVDIHRMKGDSFQIVEAMLNVAQRFGNLYNTAYLVGVEDGQIWRALEPLYKKRMNERRLYCAYETLRPMSDKMARARPLQGRMQQGRVIWPSDAPWLPQARQELLRFPAGIHDDVVDALAWAVHLCIGKEPPRLPQPPNLRSWRDSIDVNVNTGGHMAA